MMTSWYEKLSVSLTLIMLRRYVGKRIKSLNPANAYFISANYLWLSILRDRCFFNYWQQHIKPTTHIPPPPPPKKKKKIFISLTNL